ncbi:glycoside hydrolase family 43 protein [Flavobacterium franklandianum]|uniref:glycoside hydrolase family 43 protein n=1 Tax=Flavobacterium franklandianum TaxID=2594430 RepID=UPI00117AFD83|nr:glycoside hydrolase family 43 protein [Flavobacterium franklandianum]TRX29977.1 glycoside hydrolase family 43 protein [Flavobacterium franklandianum]
MTRSKTKIILLFLLLFIKNSGFGQVNYQNPVLPGFYPDPSICRVQNDYYMVNSSFGYFPGVPIFHSTNLVNWEQIGYVLDREEQLPLAKAQTTLGIFAPTIRYHDGLFYMITTNITDKGNFYVTAKNPAGPWSNPIWITTPGIDPSLFFDDNGKVYVTSAQNWGAVKNRIVMSEIDLTTGKLLSEPVTIWKGTGGKYPEGPHLYKKEGFYYLIIAEGGTEYGHKVTIARSKNIWGVYESNPANPILTHANSNEENNPIQGTGHGDLVQTTDGSWFMVALGFRPLDGHQILGRETFLAPVAWNPNEWPIVNGAGSIALDMKVEKLPGEVKIKNYNQNDDFSEGKLGFEWNYINNPIPQNYFLSERKGYLRLHGSEKSLSENPGVTFVGRRQQHFNFNVTTTIDFNPFTNNEEAGISLYKDALHHYKLFIRKKGKERELVLAYNIGKIKAIEKRIPLKKGTIKLTISGTPALYEFGFSQANNPVTTLGKAETKYLSTETAGGFTGTYIGLYATGNSAKSKAVADFENFSYKVVE